MLNYKSLLRTYYEAIDRMLDKHIEKGTSWKEISIGHLLEDIHNDFSELENSKTITNSILSCNRHSEQNDNDCKQTRRKILSELEMGADDNRYRKTI